MTQNRRQRTLVLPRLQLRLVGTFFLVLLGGFLLQSLLVHIELRRLTSAGEAGPGILEAMPAVQARVLLVSVAILLPATLAVGVLATQRIAGPAFRLERYLREVERGEANALCRLRRHDELKELCSQLNRTLTTIEARGGRVWPPEELAPVPGAKEEAAPERELSKAA